MNSKKIPDRTPTSLGPEPGSIMDNMAAFARWPRPKKQEWVEAQIKDNAVIVFSKTY